MVRTTLLGAGNIGRFVANLVVEDRDFGNVYIIEKDMEKLEALGLKIKEKATFMVGDVFKDKFLKRTVCNSDIVLSFLPGSIGVKAYNLAIECGFHLVDTSYLPEDPMTYNTQAESEEITIVPDAGVAPGLSNLIAGGLYNELGGLEKISVYVGGLPQSPVPPLYHEVNWSISDLIEEYTRPVRIKENGIVKTVEPLTGNEIIDFEGIGKLEAFYTDGLRTMVKTLDVPNMYEKTLRYPGHLNAIKLLRDIGFLSKSIINVDGKSVRPVDVAIRVLEDKMYNPTLRDILAMMIVAEKGTEKKTVKVLDYFDEKNGFSAMARTTGLCNYAISKLVLSDKIGHGVIPPEKIGMNKNNYEYILDIYRKFGVKISIS